MIIRAELPRFRNSLELIRNPVNITREHSLEYCDVAYSGGGAALSLYLEIFNAINFIQITLQKQAWLTLISFVNSI